jgi:DNA-binding NarL/FixJ family response regulator
LSLPGALSVVKQIATLQTSSVVVLGLPEDEEEVLSYAQIGVVGYITRDGSMSDVVAAIQAAARGEAHVSPRIAGSLLRRVAALSSQMPHRGARLTERESQILALMQQCMSNKMISRVLGIELATVKNHVHNILVKLGLRRRAEAIALLHRGGPAHPGSG